MQKTAKKQDIKQLIEQIKLSVSLTEVIQEHVHLTKVGRNLQGQCPFHNEKTPSFFVNETKGVWKCFGCGKSGDVINFFAEINHYNNSQAIKVLANRTGLNNTGRYRRQIEELAQKRAASKENQKKFNDAMIFLNHKIKNIIEALEWITSSFKTEQELEQFGEIYHQLVYLKQLEEESSYINDNETYILFKKEYLAYKPLLSFISTIGGRN